MKELKDELLTICKSLLPNSIKIEDAHLSLYIDIIIQKILNYCNRSDFPKELKYVAAQMVIDLIRENQSLSDNPQISSISEDGRTVNFNVNGISIAVDEKISKTTELKRFKKLYRVGDYSENVG